MTPTVPRDRTDWRASVLAAFLWSLTAVPIGLWQLADPEAGPFSSPLRHPTVPVPDALPDATAPVLLIAAGLAGLLVARDRPRLWPFTALMAVVFGLLVPTMMLVSLTGYLTAFAMPFVLVAGPVLLVRSVPARVVTAAAVAAAVVALAFAGPLGPRMVGELVAGIAAAWVDLGVWPAAELWAAAGGAIWAIMTVRLLRLRRTGRAAPAWPAPERAALWGKVCSYVAFACALPYGLTRLTWLTPWPYMLDADELSAHPEVRLWGLLLGFAAIGGGALCLGLTQRWGERWPYWVPKLQGRPVPPRVAIIPASIVAYLFTIAGISFPLMAVRSGQAEFVWVFPFYVWGPALGAATLAYAVRRRAVAAE